MLYVLDCSCTVDVGYTARVHVHVHVFIRMCCHSIPGAVRLGMGLCFVKLGNLEKAR